MIQIKPRVQPLKNKKCLTTILVCGVNFDPGVLVVAASLFWWLWFFVLCYLHLFSSVCFLDGWGFELFIE
jgi:hypothetical protein